MGVAAAPSAAARTCSGRGARTIPGEKPWDGGVGKALGSCSTPEKPSVAKWLLSKAAVAQEVTAAPVMPCSAVF